MKREIYWKLFKHTGKIEYYLKYREALRNERSTDWKDI